MDASRVWNETLNEIDHCNKCGFCLPACPTYQLTGDELASPRGRIAMVEAVARGEMAVGPGLEQALTYCLECRACETACPSGVRYHRILSAGRTALTAFRPRRVGWAARQMLRLVKHPRMLRSVSTLSNHLKMMPVPAPLKPLKPLLGYEERQIPVRSSPLSPQRGVEFFEGCVMSAIFPDANRAAKNLLQRGGLGIDSPTTQQCCGALHLHAGHVQEAQGLARTNIQAFERSSADALIVNTAGGCGAMLMEYGELLQDDPVWAQRAQAFSARVRDWTTVFRSVAAGVPLAGTGERVIMQNSCHLVNVEQAGPDAEFLASHVAGDIFVRFAGQDSCCGSAGLYNIEHPAWALAILDKKMEAVALTHPDRILVNNPGCHLQMRWGALRSNMPAGSVEHLATYLERAAQRAASERRVTRESLDTGA